jgi:long-chain acyl-CoA synthetase
LRIVDRKKHIIITAGGKNITPANIEQEIKGREPLISQVHAHGDRRAYLTALVTVHPMEAIDWAKGKGLVKDPAKADAILAELVSNPLARPEGLAELMQTVTSQPEVQQRIVNAVRGANTTLSKVETIKKIYIHDRDFSLEEDEVTPTMKVKRKEVEKKYLPIFDRLYTEKGFGLTVESEDLRGA